MVVYHARYPSKPTDGQSLYKTQVFVCCSSTQVGLRGYYAYRQLTLAGKDAVNISGGYKSYKEFKAANQLKTAKL